MEHVEQNVVSLVCVVVAGTLAALGVDGWGWFLLAAAVMVDW